MDDDKEEVEITLDASKFEDSMKRLRESSEWFHHATRNFLVTIRTDMTSSDTALD